MIFFYKCRCGQWNAFTITHSFKLVLLKKIHVCFLLLKSKSTFDQLFYFISNIDILLAFKNSERKVIGKAINDIGQYLLSTFDYLLMIVLFIGRSRIIIGFCVCIYVERVITVLISTILWFSKFITLHSIIRNGRNSGLLWKMSKVINESKML